MFLYVKTRNLLRPFGPFTDRNRLNCRITAANGIYGGMALSKQNGLRFFCSFPNKYPYKNISYNTCDLFFTLDIPDLSLKDLMIETAEVSEIRFIRPEELDLNDIAFDSIKKAVSLFVDQLTQKPFIDHG